MELNYIRYTDSADLTQRMILRCAKQVSWSGEMVAGSLVAWHESTRHHDSDNGLAADTSARVHRASDTQQPVPNGIDLSGQWEVTEIEDNKKYVATLDVQGNGPYTWQEGQFTTTSYDDRRWQGTWKQTGNDRKAPSK